MLCISSRGEFVRREALGRLRQHSIQFSGRRIQSQDFGRLIPDPGRPPRRGALLQAPGGFRERAAGGLASLVA